MAPQRPIAAGQVLWTALQVDALGKVEKQKLHNDISTLIAPEASTGRVLAQQGFAGTATTPTIQNQQYTWDSIGNLVARADAIGDGTSGAVSESFIYQDGLNRLTSYTVAATNIPGTARKVDLQYNALGMLLFKSDVGVYTYGAQGDGQTRPHALKSVTVNGVVRDLGYDANGNLITASSGPYRNLSYTSFNLPDSSTGIAGPGGTPRYTWHYDENHARLKETHASPAGTRTTWYFHPDNQGGLGFEREIAANGLISNRHYLAAGGATIGVFISRGALPTLTAAAPFPAQLPSITGVKLEYWHRDHLGSLVATSDAWGTVTARYAYDPFGKRRMTDGRYDAFGTLIVDWVADRNTGTDRGFTGHEHLDDIGLIHMNGRIFDPTLGIFLQGDPFIQDPTDLQNYNRYGYCLNNPMTCTDPTGYFSLKKFFGSYVVGFALDFFVPGLGTYLSAGYRLRMIARTKIGYQIGSIVISVLSVYCGPNAPACNAIGQMAWSALAGHSAENVLKTGAFAYVSATMNQGIGEAFPGGVGETSRSALTAKSMEVTATSRFLNTVAHAGWGCLEATMRGGACRDGAKAGAVSAAMSNYANMGVSGDDFAARATNTAIHAVTGGVVSVAGGGSLGMGRIRRRRRICLMSYYMKAGELRRNGNVVQDILTEPPSQPKSSLVQRSRMIPTVERY
ncbi:RHS repeat domain-containing protein [Ideonella paludis]|uniref:RHS repeat domain-containing protein n=1 Tax=Ideonella paludis TaxID=1233411 RepID=UPI0036316F2C